MLELFFTVLIGLEVVLFDEHGFVRTCDKAVAAVDAAILVDMRLSVAYAYRLGRADPHAVRATFANVFVYL